MITEAQRAAGRAECAAAGLVCDEIIVPARRSQGAKAASDGITDAERAAIDRAVRQISQMTFGQAARSASEAVPGIGRIAVADARSAPAPRARVSLKAAYAASDALPGLGRINHG